MPPLCRYILKSVQTKFRHFFSLAMKILGLVTFLHLKRIFIVIRSKNKSLFFSIAKEITIFLPSYEMSIKAIFWMGEMYILVCTLGIKKRDKSKLFLMELFGIFQCLKWIVSRNLENVKVRLCLFVFCLNAILEEL